MNRKLLLMVILLGCARISFAGRVDCPAGIGKSGAALQICNEEGRLLIVDRVGDFPADVYAIVADSADRGEVAGLVQAALKKAPKVQTADEHITPNKTYGMLSFMFDDPDAVRAALKELVEPGDGKSAKYAAVVLNYLGGPRRRPMR